MARIRTIKPEFWTDETIVQLDFQDRLFFIGLWNFADDDGYLFNEPARLHLQIMPADENFDPEISIEILEVAELVEILKLKDGSSAIYLPHFKDHQRISHKTDSRIAPEVSGKLRIPDRVRREVALKYGCIPGEFKDVACFYCGELGTIHWHRLRSGRPGHWITFAGMELDHLIAEDQQGKTNKENLVLACRACNRSKATGEAMAVFSKKLPEHSGNFQSHPEKKLRKGMEGNGREGKGKGLKTVRSKKDFEPTRENFEEVWEPYPWKRGKEKAFLKFKVQIKSVSDLVDIKMAVANYIIDVERIRETRSDHPYQNGSTWFNQNWKDYINPPESKTESADRWDKARAAGAGKVKTNDY